MRESVSVLLCKPRLCAHSRHFSVPRAARSVLVSVPVCARALSARALFLCVCVCVIFPCLFPFLAVPPSANRPHVTEAFRLIALRVFARERAPI